ncbi:MAG: sigma-54-dependent Fis family transcriptional regulator [Candidatus Schekmanbacteria bacterium]|nr:sigma-54-dependent Fis family transcriptional regulator [Candidatus Schekmanbacteria bacterium]
MSESATIVVVDDEPLMLKFLVKSLRNEGHDVFAATNGEEALALVDSHNPDALIADLKMPGMTGIELLEKAKSRRAGLDVIVMTGFATVDSAVEAMKKGAADYITKPFSPDAIKLAVAKLLAHRRVLRENDALKDQLAERFGFDKLIGQSRKMQDVYRMVQTVAGATVVVLIEGESGTGKELVARAIHANSARSGGPFVAVNCSALVQGLFESEMFGHERGAFTGAVQTRLGRFELANGGTIFLDEVSELAQAAQVKLLRVLQERQVERVGGARLRDVDVRVISASNRNVRKCVESGSFREDLYYRLNVVRIELPPLRERLDDLPILVEHFLASEARRRGATPKRLSSRALEALLRHSWPGNVRELQNIIAGAVALSPSAVIVPEHFPPGALRPDADPVGADALPLPGQISGTLVDALDAIEKRLIARALERCHWVQVAAAKELGIKRATLQYKMAKYGLLGKA